MVLELKATFLSFSLFLSFPAMDSAVSALLLRAERAPSLGTMYKQRVEGMKIRNPFVFISGNPWLFRLLWLSAHWSWLIITSSLCVCVRYKQVTAELWESDLHFLSPLWDECLKVNDLNEKKKKKKKRFFWNPKAGIPEAQACLQ